MSSGAERNWYAQQLPDAEEGFVATTSASADANGVDLNNIGNTGGSLYVDSLASLQATNVTCLNNQAQASGGCLFTNQVCWLLFFLSS